MMPKVLVMADARSVHTDRWCAYLESEGFTVGLFSLEPKTIEHPKLFFAGKRPTGKGLIDYSLARNHFLKMVREFEPDIVSAHFVNSYGWLASFCDICPVVATAWGSDILILPHKWRIHQRRVNKALKHAVYCTVDNNNLFDAVKAYIPEDKIIRVVMGIEKSFHNEVIKKEFNTSPITRIIAPRGLQVVYDPDTIISAVELLKGKGDFHLTLLGKEPEAKRYRRLIREKSLDEFMSIQPMMPHKQYTKSLPEYDIYLSASRSDSTSVALLEAMSVGLYPVVSDIVGNKEWVTDNENGFLFQVGNPEALAKALGSAMREQADFPSVANRNRAIIEQNGIWQDNMEKVKRLFLELSAR